MQDQEYRAFQSRLIPTVPGETVIGVRTPLVRKLAKKLSKTSEAALFMETLPHTYYEENNLHAFLIERLSGYDETVEALDRFLPFVDNWSTCDSLVPKVLKQRPDETLSHIKRWIKSPHEYTVRFAVGLLMRFFLDERFDPAQLALVAELRRDEYYINMMAAWYFATALAKQYDAAVLYITENRLPVWTHSKTIQKAVESYRVTAEHKLFLRTHRRKE